MGRGSSFIVKEWSWFWKSSWGSSLGGIEAWQWWNWKV